MYKIKNHFGPNLLNNIILFELIFFRPRMSTFHFAKGIYFIKIELTSQIINYRIVGLVDNTHRVDEGEALGPRRARLSRVRPSALGGLRPSEGTLLTGEASGDALGPFGPGILDGAALSSKPQTIDRENLKTPPRRNTQSTQAKSHKPLRAKTQSAPGSQKG